MMMRRALLGRLNPFQTAYDMGWAMGRIWGAFRHPYAALSGSSCNPPGITGPYKGSGGSCPGPTHYINGATAVTPGYANFGYGMYQSLGPHVSIPTLTSVMPGGVYFWKPGYGLSTSEHFGARHDPSPEDYRRPWDPLPWRTPWMDPNQMPVGAPGEDPVPAPYPAIPNQPNYDPERAPNERPVRGPQPRPRPRVRPRDNPVSAPSPSPRVPPPPPTEPDLPPFEPLPLPPQPIPAPQPGIELTPDGPRPIESEHKFNRPPLGTKENKIQTTLPRGMISDIINGLTEFDDTVKALYKALPKGCRKAARQRAAKRGQRRYDYGDERRHRREYVGWDGDTNEGARYNTRHRQGTHRIRVSYVRGKVRFTRYDRMEALKRCWAEMDASKAIEELIKEKLEDIYWGTIGKFKGRAKRWLYDKWGIQLPDTGGFPKFPYKIIYG